MTDGYVCIFNVLNNETFTSFVSIFFNINTYTMSVAEFNKRMSWINSQAEEFKFALLVRVRDKSFWAFANNLVKG